MEEKRESVLIIGGTSGLGRAVAVQARRWGLMTTVTGRSAAKVEEKTRPYDDLWGAQFLTHDLSSREDPWGEVGLYVQQHPPDRIFLVAGVFKQKAIAEMKRHEVIEHVGIHLTGTYLMLSKIHEIMRRRGKPYHLVVVSSTSSFRMRKHQTAYTMVQAGKAHLARNLTVELFEDLPGSKAALVHPGGMKTDFFAGTDTDISKMMDPAAVAAIIWSRALDQGPWDEYRVIRDDDGLPRVEPGAPAIESPSLLMT